MPLARLLPALQPHRSLDHYLRRFFSDARTRLAFSFHPLAIVALLAIQWVGLVRFVRGKPAPWKGRTYAPASV